MHFFTQSSSLRRKEAIYQLDGRATADTPQCKVHARHVRKKYNIPPELRAANAITHYTGDSKNERAAETVAETVTTTYPTTRPWQSSSGKCSSLIASVAASMFILLHSPTMHIQHTCCHVINESNIAKCTLLTCMTIQHM